MSAILFEARCVNLMVMACRMFGAKPLPEPMLAYCQLDCWEKTFQWNSNRNAVIFIQENAFELVVWQNGGHFVQGEMCYCVDNTSTSSSG